MIPYYEYEKQVFDWLMAKNKKDGFTFGLRKKGGKGVGPDHFIGTASSNYFATTFWTIPVSFAGSAGDLIQLLFRYSSNKQELTYHFEFNHTQSPHDQQNQYALDLLKELKDPIEREFGLKIPFNAENRIFSLKTRPVKPAYEHIDQMLRDVDSQLYDLIKIVDEGIDKIKSQYPDFKAERISAEEFENNLSKTRKRIDEFNSVVGGPQVEGGISEPPSIPSYWLYHPGENGRLWDRFYAESVIGLGWDYLGDLTEYNSKEDIAIRLRELGNSTSSKMNDANANWDFAKTMDIGDIVIVKRGRHTLLGYGEVVSNYSYVADVAEYKHRRRVKWLKTGKWKVSFPLVLKTLTNITPYESDMKPGHLFPEYLLDVMLDNPPLNEKSIVNFPLNQILFGPPGTGKTYHTINKAISIIEGKSEKVINSEDRQTIRSRFKGYVDSEQITFTTFHQSMSYEDFVEGIKPATEEDEDGNKTVIYDIEDGIFKRIVANAKKSKHVNPREEYGFADAWNSLITKAEEQILEENFMKLPLLTKNRSISIINITSNGNIKLKPENGRERGYTVSFKRLKKLYDAFTDLSAVSNIDKEFRSVIGGSNSSAYWSVLNYINNAVVSNSGKAVSIEPPKPHVLIIDEINRGNISAIFGELITLIEESKRAGKAESLEVTLPYSKEKFSVPANLYIIGTMNTADRSVEALDSALRRRFVFEEMLPEPEILDYKLFGYQASDILRTINKRIEKLIDKDHCIGHAYFIGQNEDSIVSSFYKNIIPLLQEYFFGDYGKIGLVLGKGFVRQKSEDKMIFAAFDYEYQDDLSNRPVYEIIDYTKHRSVDIGGLDFDFATAITCLMGDEK